MTDPQDAGPEDLARLFDRAVALHREGRLTEAVAAYEQFIAVAPRHAAARGNLGVALRSLGQTQAALGQYDAAIALNPGSAEAHSRRGNALLDLNLLEQALASFDAAVAIAPSQARLHNNRGNALLRLARPVDALASFDQAIGLDPGLSAAHYNRGNALRMLQQPVAALAAYDAALSLNPGAFDALVNRGDTLSVLGRDDEALESLDAAIRVNPHGAGAHYNRANVLMDQGRLEAALASYDATLALQPDHDQAGWNRTIVLLKLERFAEAWPAYERRWQRDEFVSRSSGQVTPALRTRLDPMLRAEDLADRDVLLIGEEGIGDVLMFASMLPDVLASAARVSLLCSTRLHSLLAHAFPQLALLAPGADIGPADFDHVMAIGSLARLYRNQANTFPGKPYVVPRPEIRDRWRDRLGPKSSALRVGLSWRGGSASTGRDARSIALRDLTPLLQLTGVEFVSLQYGDHRDEVASVNAGLGAPIRQFAPQDLNDIEDLTALAMSLDLIVSVQTALVHMAGAAGVPCLALLPRITSWRYGVSGASMLWYDSVTLFRQDGDRQWSPVIARVIDHLSKMIAPPSEAS